MSITIYGSSDDRICVEGDITEEFVADLPGYDYYLAAISDGTVLRVEFNHDGVWRIQPLITGVARLTVVQAPIDDEENYSDRATLEADHIDWVVVNDEIGRNFKVAGR